MKWFNPKDKLPEDKQKVLISAGGINFIAVYDEPKRLFYPESLKKDLIFTVDSQDIYWTTYTEPPKTK